MLEQEFIGKYLAINPIFVQFALLYRNIPLRRWRGFSPLWRLRRAEGRPHRRTGKAGSVVRLLPKSLPK
jgi:hypothetical protein